MAANPFAARNPFALGAAALAERPQETVLRRADVVFVIDASASMAPLWKHLQQAGDIIPELLDDACAASGLDATDVRLRFITFQDIFMQDAALACSPFYTFPKDVKAAREFLSGVAPSGRGGPCTSGLEALMIALHSPWRRDKGVRHRIAVITDSAAYLPDDPLRKFDQHYDSIMGCYLPDPARDIPGQMSDLRRLWRDGVGSIDNWGSRILLYTVSEAPWMQMVLWPRVTPRQEEASKLHSLQLGTLLRDILSTL